MVDDMRRSFSAVLLFGALLHTLQGASQTHKVAKPEQVVRAVGVYEWTGDLKKPTASRLIPVSLFIDGAIQDAGVYLARPIPFALTPGNEYELQQAGIAKGSLELAYARHLQTTDSGFEDGWFGYGSFKAPAAAKKEPVLRASKTQPVLTSSKDDSRPHFGTKDDADAKKPESETGKSAPPDPEDTAKKKDSTGTSADDPDRPTMRRRGTSTSPSTTDTAQASPGSSPENDPDRPTLKRRSPDDAKKNKKADDDVAFVTGTGSLNDDPDRPRLQRGARSTTSDSEIGKLIGLPKNLNQMVAVSDAANRSPHDFVLSWQDDKQRLAVLAQMQSLARAQLLSYQADPLANPGSTPAPSPAARRISPAPRTARSSAPSPRKTVPKPAVKSELPLLDEELKAYTLSYGGAPTYIYTAHTAGAGADLRYVTVVAQADLNGDLRPAIRSVTDEAHLDRTPRMRFIDAVDAEASNRASLLFELRSQSVRQFALYRVIGSRADTFFTTGTTQ